MDQEAAAFLARYGYLAIFIGAFIEGETIVLLAGFLSYQGYFQAPGSALAAFAGSLLSDQIMYLLGRYKGPWLFARFPRLAKAVKRLAAKVQGREIPLILSFRFIYGIRNVTPVFLGASGTRPSLYIPLNAISAAVWASAMTAIGYFAGEALPSFLGKLHAYKPFILGGLLIAAAAFWLYRRRSR